MKVSEIVKCNFMVLYPAVPASYLALRVRYEGPACVDGTLSPFLYRFTCYSGSFIVYGSLFYVVMSFGLFYHLL